jgi:uncharacterized protein YecE (DUF72 family)
MANIRVGISGWRYEPWRGVFYPDDLPQRLELHYASRQVTTIEINGSFYALQRPESYAKWREEAPQNFEFAVKAPRFITHIRRLKDVAEPLSNFLASGIFNLGNKLGPLLWQFPPNFKYDRARMEAFLEMLPYDSDSAAKLAAHHSDWMKERVQLDPGTKRPLRHAIEIRNETFLDETFVELLRAHEVAFVIAESARHWPMVHDITANFVYMRLHGDKELYDGGYGDKALGKWAERIRTWQRGAEPEDASRISKGKAPPVKERDVYCYFDNTDVKLRAPRDAQTLMRMLGVAKPVE